ncbi:hypothetical protein [Algoriphagus namhaensis]
MVYPQKNNALSIFCLLMLSFLVFACGKNPNSEALALLKKSAEAYGGQDKWEQVEQIEFRKWTQLLDSAGNIESEVDQLQQFRLLPYFEAEISWEKDSITHLSRWDGQKMFYQMGSNEIQNPDFLAQRKKDIDAAFYAFAQPWKLIDDPAAQLQFLGERDFEGKPALTIQVDYGPDSDIWWYYFHPETFLILGNEVQLKDHRSLLVNGPLESVDGMLFHGPRKSYRVDENGNKLYLRADYRYSDYRIAYQTSR